MGGFFSSPSSIEKAATANEYRNFRNTTSSPNNSAATNNSPKTNNTVSTNVSASTSSNSASPSTRRNRRMNGGKRRSTRKVCTRKRR